MPDGKGKINPLTNKPILIGGFGEINFGKQYKPGNRVYDSRAIAMCILSNPVGHTGEHSYLYLMRAYNDENEKD